MYGDVYAVGHANKKLKTGELQTRCSYENGVWMFYVLYPDMHPLEAANIQEGKISTAFAVIEDELFLLCKAGDIPWFDTPFEPARYTDPQEYREFDTGKAAPVTIIGADSNTGIVRALRAFSLCNAMSSALHAVCRDMDVRHRPLDVKKQNAHLQEIYKKYQLPEDMLRCVKPEHITVFV